MTNRQKSYFYIILVILSWASGPVVVKLLTKNFNSLQANFFVALFATFGLFLTILFQNRLSLLRGYSKKDFGTMARMGFLGCFLYPVFLFGAFWFAPAQEAFTINYLWPIFVVIFAIPILKEKFSFRKVFGVLFGFVGVYVVISGGEILTPSFNYLRGDILAGLAACSWGLFSVLGKKLPYEKFSSMLIYYCFGFIFVAIAVLFFSHIPIPSKNDLMLLAYLGAWINGMAYVFWFKALEYGDTAKMANFVFLVPFVSLIFIYLIIGEKILWSSAIGLIIIVMGILVQSVKTTKLVKQNES